jgi:hypothetical protein
MYQIWFVMNGYKQRDSIKLWGYTTSHKFDIDVICISVTSSQRGDNSDN